MENQSRKKNWNLHYMTELGVVANKISKTQFHFSYTAQQVTHNPYSAQPGHMEGPWKSYTEGHMGFFLLAPSFFKYTGHMHGQPHHMTAQHEFFSAVQVTFIQSHSHIK